MKSVGISGSPRKTGNCNALLEHFLQEAERHGAETKMFTVSDMANVSGCIACGACKQKAERCVLEDDLAVVLRAVETADIVVYATPVYFGDASAQFKPAFDRHYSFLKGHTESRLKKGKAAVFILSQGHDDEHMYDSVIRKYEGCCKFIGFQSFYPVRMTGATAPGTAATRPDIIASVDRLAATLCSPQTGKP